MHAAIDAYSDYAKTRYVSIDDGMTSEFGLAEIRRNNWIKRHFPDRCLTDFDMHAIDELRNVIRKRPMSQKTKKPISVETVRNTVKTVNRFITWLHKAREWDWRKPVDYVVERMMVPETNEEIQARYNPAANPTYTNEQLQILFKYATPMERTFILLGLNCGFREKEVLGLKKKEYDLNTKILARVRKKTKVYGQWHLWAITCDALRWVEAIRPNKDDAIELIQTQEGAPLGKRTKAGNRGSKLAKYWNRLIVRVRKDHTTFPDLSFSSLRDLGSSVLREKAGGEISEMYLSHGNPIPKGALLENYGPSQKFCNMY